DGVAEALRRLPRLARARELPRGDPHRQEDEDRGDHHEHHVRGGGEVEREAADMDVGKARQVDRGDRLEVDGPRIRRVVHDQLTDVDAFFVRSFLDHRANRISMNSRGTSTPRKPNAEGIGGNSAGAARTATAIRTTPPMRSPMPITQPAPNSPSGASSRRFIMA